jgi:hypothetical protein
VVREKLSAQCGCYGYDPRVLHTISNQLNAGPQLIVGESHVSELSV